VHPSPEASHKKQPKAANGPAHTSIPLHVYKPRHSITLARAHALPILPSGHPLTRHSGAGVALLRCACPPIPMRRNPPAPPHQAAAARSIGHRSSPTPLSHLGQAAPQQQLAARSTGTGLSGIGSQHSAPAIDLLRPSTFHFAPPVVDLLHLGATSPAKNTTEPSTLCSVVQPLFLSRLAACLFLFRLCCL
jgi:hypothetical protein